MLLSNMTYEEIYREIRDDFRDVRDYYDKVLRPNLCKRACKSSKYPWRNIEGYTHPKSKNNYVYFSIVKKHSLWESPEVTVFCDYEGKYGKEIITIAIWKDRKTFQDALVISVFQAHFFKRYFERFIKDDTAEADKIIIFLARNAYSLPLSAEAVSAKELLKDEPGYINTAMLNLDGLCLGKIRNENRNIIIYKTFLPFDELHHNQNEKVFPEYIRMMATHACADYPHCAKTINDMYMTAARNLHEIAQGDNHMTEEERYRAFMKEYSTACHALSKYIII